jgi:hypothetical protein
LIPGDLSIDMKVRASFESKVPPAPSLFVVGIYFPEITEARWRRSIYFCQRISLTTDLKCRHKSTIPPSWPVKDLRMKNENPLIRPQGTLEETAEVSFHLKIAALFFIHFYMFVHHSVAL